MTVCLYLCCRCHRRQRSRKPPPLPRFIPPPSDLVYPRPPGPACFVGPLFRPSHPNRGPFNSYGYGYPNQGPPRPPNINQVSLKPPPPTQAPSPCMQQNTYYSPPPPPSPGGRARGPKHSVRNFNTALGQQPHIPEDVYDGLDLTPEMFDGQAYLPGRDQTRRPQTTSDLYDTLDITPEVAGIWQTQRL
jgi:hypothetical protein